MNGPPDIGPLELALASALVLLNAGASAWLQLGLGKKLLLASIRALVQLTLLGMLLDWVFATRGPAFVLTWMGLMIVVAGSEAVRRTSRRVPGLLRLSVLVMLASSMSVTLYALTAILGHEPWYAPRFAIPVLGMLLGNTLNGIALGLQSTLSGFERRRDEVELLLAHGATRLEASRDILRDAVRTGMIPIVNSLVIAGVVSIPGMMTGQMFAGVNPALAARYQVVILFCIAGGVALGTVAVCFGVTRLVFDARDRLRTDWISAREG